VSGPGRPPRRRIRPGDTFTILEDLAEDIERDDVPPDPAPPPEATRGEPWEWTKGPPYPRGWPRAPREWRDGENFDGTR